MKIYMVRHGQTDSNVAKRIMGNGFDDPLNDEGKRQAEDLAGTIADQHFDVIFSSPLKRAAETARIIAGSRSVPLMFRDELKERGFGSLTQKTFAEAEKLIGKLWNQFQESDADAECDKLYGREPLQSFKKRLLTFADEVKNTYRDKRVLVVTHGGVMRLSNLLFKGSDTETAKNASIEEFEI